MTSQNPNNDDPKYRAPALEKGLDMLELMSKSAVPLSLNEIAEKLNRSRAELYRMAIVLENRGYLEKVGEKDHYGITNKLLALGAERRPEKDLIEFALPVMRELAAEIHQSCHIVVKSDDDVVVIGRVQALDMVNYSVRVGHRRKMVMSASGRVLYAFQNEVTRSFWHRQLSATTDTETLEAFVSDSLRVAKLGYFSINSLHVTGVTEISIPLMHDGAAIAALSVPFIERVTPSLSYKKSLERVHDTARLISETMEDGKFETF